MRASLKAGQRYRYTERGVDLLLEIKKIYTTNVYYDNLAVKILSIKKDIHNAYRVGVESFSTDAGTLTYLQGQDKPKSMK